MLMYYHPAVPNPAALNGHTAKERNTMRTLKTSAYYINLGAAVMLIAGLPKAEAARFTTTVLVTDILIDKGLAATTEDAFGLMSPEADQGARAALAELVTLAESLTPILDVIGKSVPEDSSRDAAMYESGEQAVAKILERRTTTQSQQENTGSSPGTETRRRCGQQEVLTAQ